LEAPLGGSNFAGLIIASVCVAVDIKYGFGGWEVGGLRWVCCLFLALAGDVDWDFAVHRGIGAARVPGH